jgi:predicted nucleic acid-binding protein
VADRIVVNTGPLISFSRIGCLDVIGQLPYEFLCPVEVRQELAEGSAAGHPWVTPRWLNYQALTTAPPRALLAGLDLGETAVIQLGLELEVHAVAIDEWKGRRAALASGLRVTGSLGLLGRAKSQGLIPELKPLLEKAVAAGIWYNPELIRTVLEAAGE